MILRPKDFMNRRFVLIKKYPSCPFDLGEVLAANEYEGITYIKYGEKGNIHPLDYKDHFRELKWHEHRTIEQLKSITYAKVVDGSNYYGIGDIVEVIDMFYNNPKFVNGKDSIMFNLNGHWFTASEINPATKEDHTKFWAK